jgi:hypothetical protein
MTAFVGAASVVVVERTKESVTKRESRRPNIVNVRGECWVV